MSSTIRPESLARLRSAEKLTPGQWWLGKYEDEDGSDLDLWAEVQIVMEKQRITDGLKFVHAIGVATDGYRVELVAERGEGVRSLTVAEGKRCGLTVPAIGAQR